MADPFFGLVRCFGPDLDRVAPLVPREQMKGALHLNPLLSFAGQDYWLATHELFAVDQRVLRGKVATLADHRDAIIAALDFSFIGF